MTFSDAIVDDRRPEATLNFRGGGMCYKWDRNTFVHITRTCKMRNAGGRVEPHCRNLCCQLAGRRSHTHIGNDLMLVPFYSIFDVESSMSNQTRNAKQCALIIGLQPAFSHKRGMIGSEADMCWLFDEDRLREPGII